MMSNLEPPIYDRTEALARLDGDTSLFSEMAGIFVAENDAYCRALEDALAAGDAPALRREAHTVKSLFATFSYEAGRELAMRLEHLAATGSLDGAEVLTKEVVAAVKRLGEAFAGEAT